jgi:ABC-2 type transport system permease protein
VSASLGVQIGTLARRTIARTIRQPILVMPNFIFPLFMLAMLSAGASQTTKLKGFPTPNSYITFIIGATLVQGATAATMLAGNAVASDIDSGFFSRLQLTPMRSSALIGSQLLGVIVLSGAQAVAYLLIGLIFGVHIKAGVPGAFAAIGVTLLIVLAFGSIGLFAAIRSGSAEGLQTIFTVTLGLMFLSSMVIPRNLMSTGWFKSIATYNPVSYLVEAPRSLFVTGWDGKALALGCGIALAIGAIALTAAAWTLGRKLVRA